VHTVVELWPSLLVTAGRQELGPLAQGNLVGVSGV
jgi:hypothetical protein